MSVPLTPYGLSNLGAKPWVITVLVVIIVMTWSVAANALSAYLDALALVTTLMAGRAVQQRSTATAPTSTARA
ncbi:hypothetical protein OHS71_27410 [Streptomyces sp. NBC_00377]|uniref:hypothetical protein n=1 Tax=unclassified Streptomyces TaxID=2593676 RepID=UPI002E233B7C|nr:MULTISPECIES: hypothetical protein [unclassified Streptomyces]